MFTTRRQSLAALACAGLLLALPSSVRTQYRVQPVAERPSHAALGLVLRQLNSVGSLMMTTAHPDDENTALLARYKYQHGLRTTLVTATRGNGGQNEIGPEIFESLAVLRTEELLAAHRIDGAEQYFARAVDFGFSFSRDETYERWHKEKIVEDYVYWIRRIRPDVIVGFIWDHTQGGGQHHQASSAITAEAFRLAADPTKFPAQIAAGLRPWQASKFYYTGSFFGPPDKVPAEKVCRVDGNHFDPLIGRTYNELGSEARSMHMCQGMPQLYSLPGPQPRAYVLQDSVLTIPELEQNKDLLAGVETNLRSLAKYGRGGSPALGLAIESLEGQVRNAQLAFDTKGVAGARAALPQVLTTIRALRAQLVNMHPDEHARYEVDFRLEQKERQAEEALRLASGLRVDLLADDGLIVGGQSTKVSLRAFAGDEGVAVKSVAFEGLDGAAACQARPLEAGRPYACDVELAVPATAKLTTAYWKRLPDRDYYDFDPEAPFGLPFEPTPFTAKVTWTIGGQDQVVSYPVQFRHEGNVFSGEKRQELLVVPTLAVRLGADVVAFPGGGQTRDISVTVTNHAKSGGMAAVALQLPSGWTSQPASESVTFAREDEARQVRFRITPPTGTKPGRYEVKAIARRDGQSYDKGYEVIEYPHIHRRHLVADAAGSLKVLDLEPVTGITVGYIMGVGDQVPPALEQLGAVVELLSPEQLASADLSRYDVVMTGVRAYERRADLRAYNQRLLDYAARGGTVIVQYNKYEFNEAQYGPYPGTVGRPSQNAGPFGRYNADRVTDEKAPVKVLAPDHPVFNTPNRITDATWDGWVQERGLYFFGSEAADKRYVDLVEMSDPFPNNPGVKRGALVEAKVGQGRWIYVGLNLWRQLPAGTDGAYALTANLLSLGKR
jgi:LmbE family N-acetylglucosaminyl deacetylase